MWAKQFDFLKVEIFGKSRILAAYGRLEEVLESQMLTRRRPNGIQVTRRAALLLEE